MKKISILLFLVVGLFSFVSAQSSHLSGYHNFNRRATYVSGFEGDKPLEKDTMVEITEIFSNGIMMIPDSYRAYKGENRKTFLERRKKEDSILVANLLPQKTLQSEPQKVEKTLTQTSTKFDYLKALVIFGFVAFLFAMILVRKR